MRSRRADRLLVEDMLESMGRIAGYTAGMGREEFLSDRKTIDAVVRNLLFNRFSIPFCKPNTP